MQCFGYNNKSLVVDLILFTVSNHHNNISDIITIIIVVGSYLEPVTYLVISFGPNIDARYDFIL